MSQDPTKIFAGPARIFAGITNPATGTPPTWMTHTAGVPATGTDVGFTQGDAVLDQGPTLKLISAEQSLAPVDAITTDEMVQLMFNMLERNFAAMQLAFQNIGSLSDGTGTGFYGGNGSSILAPKMQGVMLSGIQRNAPTKFEILVIYKATNIKRLSTAYNRSKESVIAVQLTGIADLSRNAGDQLFQWKREA